MKNAIAGTEKKMPMRTIGHAFGFIMNKNKQVAKVTTAQIKQITSKNKVVLSICSSNFFAKPLKFIFTVSILLIFLWYKKIEISKKTRSKKGEKTKDRIKTSNVNK